MKKLGNLTRQITAYVPRDKTLLMLGSVLALCLAITWVLHFLFGRRLIELIYKSHSVGLMVMKGRANTPLQAYYERANELLLGVTFWSIAALVMLAVLAFLIRQPISAFLSFCSVTLCSLILFTLFELLPSLIEPLKLNQIDYYAWKNCCLPDDTLGFRSKPLLNTRIPSFKGYLYSPKYGVQVSPLSVELSADKDGFMNNSGSPEFPDVLLIGDSFVADALTENDSFGRRLERASGLTVTNLGVGGYGPFQYLEVLRRYGVQRKPKYAFFVFYAGNDIEDITAYLEWKEGRAYHYTHLFTKPFLRRYFAALVGVGRYLGRFGERIWSMALTRLNNLSQNPTSIHPDLALLKLRNNTSRILISPENKVTSTAALISSQEGQALKQILFEFKNLCRKNHIVPIIIYIPTITSIYSEHSTGESGKNWLYLRHQQIARKQNTENAMIGLAQELDIGLISLSPPFEAAAEDGELIFYPFDTHWNSKGREVAAEYVAEKLRNAFIQQGGSQRTVYEHEHNPF